MHQTRNHRLGATLRARTRGTCAPFSTLLVGVVPLVRIKMKKSVQARAASSEHAAGAKGELFTIKLPRGIAAAVRLIATVQEKTPEAVIAEAATTDAISSLEWLSRDETIPEWTGAAIALNSSGKGGVS